MNNPQPEQPTIEHASESAAVSDQASSKLTLREDDPGVDLTAWQRHFAREIAKGRSRPDAYQAAYPNCPSRKAANGEGGKLGRDIRILRYAQWLIQQAPDPLQVSGMGIDELEIALARWIWLDPRRLYDEQTGNMIDPRRWPADIALAVQEIREDVSLVGSGDDVQPVLKRVVKFVSRSEAMKQLTALRGYVKEASRRDVPGVTFEIVIPVGPQERGKSVEISSGRRSRAIRVSAEASETVTVEIPTVGETYDAARQEDAQGMPGAFDITPLVRHSGHSGSEDIRRTATGEIPTPAGRRARTICASAEPASVDAEDRTATIQAPTPGRRRWMPARD